LSLRYDSDAEEESRKAAQWYEAQQAGLGKDFLAALADAEEAVQSNPRRYPLSDWVQRRQVREIMLSRFPYLVIYEIMPNEELVILAVAHAHRRSGYWKRRRG
jgi:hypothetical protein